ncbi:MAG: DUF1566 domain-containing protein [Candidatus Omnitrophota bacterium]|jgi:hypothetical protein|nr:MAG: DUF1566 domain-containing protein [Candidatus Omnitrophota bacterium]
MQLHLKHRKASRILKRAYEINSDGGLPKTGQSMIYQPGDDGSYQMGYPLGGEARFIDNADGTVVDLATGLMWIKNPQEAGLGSPMYWYDAINACENLDFAGHNDWRLPNINELMSIVDHSRYDPAFDPLFFTPFSDTWTPCWSSTSSASWIDGAWAMYPYDGYKTTWGKPWDMCYVRPVRGGQA